MPIEAVIWDFGGVFTSSPFEAFNRFEAERGLPKDLIRQINAANPDSNAWALFERAEIDAAGFDRVFADEAKALGHDVRGADILPLLSGMVRPRMVAALKACKAAGLKVGCITNNMASHHSPGGGRMGAAGTEVGEIMGMFDALIESSKAGVRKPDPRIYLMMCDLLSVAPPACVYLDDLGINCKPAAQLGMKAIKVVDPDMALAELSEATGLSFGLEPA